MRVESALRRQKKSREEQGVAIFFLRVSDPYAPPAVKGSSIPGVVDIAKSTGGQAFFSEAMAVKEGVVPLISAIHRQWALDLVPAQAPDQKLHSLTIKSSQKDLQLSVPAHVFLP